jgi:hypothetical protein
MALTGISTAFGLGFVYFIASIPAGVAAGTNVGLAAAAAWLGYTLGGALVLVAGAPLRCWLVRKLNIPVERDPSKFIWRVWDRGGLAGLGLLAPVTIGPQAGSLLALAIGEKSPRILLAMSLGVIPWCVLFAALTSLGFKLAG